MLVSVVNQLLKIESQKVGGGGGVVAPKIFITFEVVQSFPRGIFSKFGQQPVFNTSESKAMEIKSRHYVIISKEWTKVSSINYLP